MSKPYAKNQCQECKTNPRPGQRKCLKCHAEYVRQWRLEHPGWHRNPKLAKPSPKREKARRIADQHQKKGFLVKKPCEVCGKENSQKHHTNYNKPLEVQWLCPKHHAEADKKFRVERAQALWMP